MISLQRNSKKAFFFGAIAGGIQTLVTLAIGARISVVVGVIAGYMLYAIGYFIYFTLTEESDNGHN